MAKKLALALGVMLLLVNHMWDLGLTVAECGCE